MSMPKFSLPKVGVCTMYVVAPGPDPAQLIRVRCVECDDDSILILDSDKHAVMHRAHTIRLFQSEALYNEWLQSEAAREKILGLATEKSS